MKKNVRIFALMLALAFLLTGCGKSRRTAVENGYYAAAGDYEYPSEGLMMGASAKSMPAPAAAYDEAWEEAVTETEMPAPDVSNGANIPANRKIIRNADVSVQTLDYEAFLAQVEARIAAVGGYIESSSVGGNAYNQKKSSRTAYYTARVPSDRLDEFLDTACEGGYVTAKNIYTNDVTASYTDTEARLAALKTERETLMGLLEQAKKMEDVITIYDRLTDVNYEIESYEGRIRSYDEQIAYSSVSISVKEVAKPAQVAPETRWQELKRRFTETCENLYEGALDAGVGFIAALPALLLWAVILFAAYKLIRRFIKKKLAKRAAKRAALQAEKEASVRSAGKED